MEPTRAKIAAARGSFADVRPLWAALGAEFVSTQPTDAGGTSAVRL